MRAEVPRRQAATKQSLGIVFRLRAEKGGGSSDALKRFCDPEFDERLPGDAEAPRFSVKRCDGAQAQDALKSAVGAQRTISIEPTAIVNGLPMARSYHGERRPKKLL
jgi:hypothetical protein